LRVNELNSIESYHRNKLSMNISHY